MKNIIRNFKKFNLKGIEFIYVFIVVFFAYPFIFSLDVNNINFYHHLIFIICIYIIFRLLGILFRVSKIYKNTINFLFFILLVIESLLGLSVHNFQINNLIGSPINNLYLYEYPNIYHTPPPLKKCKFTKSEFTFERDYNSLGFSDVEWDTVKNDNIRILCLGDSFTEGDGVISDSSYVSILRNKLKIKFKNIEVMNAGNCGSDPFFNFKNYKDKLVNFHPDIIIQEFSEDDFYSDILMRGGNERFINDSTVYYKETPKYNKIYALSYTYRVLVNSIGLYIKYFIANNNYNINTNKLKTIDLFKEYNELSSKNNTELICFSFPYFKNFGDNINNEFHKEMESSFSKFGLNFYNLQPCYEDQIKNSHTKFQDYYWKIDGHHNAKGYEMMAKCIEEIVAPIIEKREENQNTLVN